MFTFPVLDQKSLFWANLVRKIKIVSLSRNLVPRLTWTFGIQRWCSLFLFSTGNTFQGTLGEKKIVFALDYFEYAELCRKYVAFTFTVLDQKNLFSANLVKIKIVSLSGNLVPRLIWTCGIQWWCLLFLFSTGNTGEIWWKKTKLSVWAEISH